MYFKTKFKKNNYWFLHMKGLEFISMFLTRNASP